MKIIIAILRRQLSSCQLLVMLGEANKNLCVCIEATVAKNRCQCMLKRRHCCDLGSRVIIMCSNWRKNLIYRKSFLFEKIKEISLIIIYLKEAGMVLRIFIKSLEY
jgi:hypothetical protein